MPIYGYICLDCGNIYEKKGSYEELSKFDFECPECHFKNSRKMFFPVSALFKGKGFYKTDNRKDKKSEDNAWKN